MISEVAALTHGASGLALAYGAVEVPLLAGLLKGRAPPSKLLLSPLIAIPVTLASGVALGMMNPLLHASAAAYGGLFSAAIGLGVCGALGYASGSIIAAATRPRPNHQRGTVLTQETSDASPERAPQALARDRQKDITLCNVRLQAADETKHFKLIGTTGTGKSTAIHEMLRAALDRGDRAVIADPDGGYMRRFYRPERGDIVLNPFERGSVKWDLFGEINEPYDIEQLARSLIPDHDGSDRSWRGYGRTLFTAITRQAHAAQMSDLGELFRLLVVAGNGELRTLLAGTPAQPFLEEHNARMFDSVRSVTISAVAALEHVAKQGGNRFSVREWVRQDGSGGDGGGAGGVLFIPYRAGQIAALKTQISAWMRLAIFEAMNGEEGDRRLWFVIDELDALGPIDGLKDALARLRKFGGRCVLGFQSIAQVSSTYGEGDAHTIVENCGNTLILRCSASEGGGTSRFASSLVGDREILRTTESRTRRPDDWLATRTYSDHFVIEPALLPSQIEQLPDLAGFLKLASQPHWRRVDLVPHGAARDSSVAVCAAAASARWQASRRERASESGSSAEVPPWTR